MNRKERHLHRRIRAKADSHERQTIINDLRTFGTEITPAQAEEFRRWRNYDGWQRYQEERMKKYTEAQNRLDSLSLAVPNGRKDTKYKAEIALPDFRDCEISVVGLTPLGLEYELLPNGYIYIKGVPLQVGDFSFKIRVKLPKWKTDDPILERQINIAFNQNPRDLWVNLPVPKNIIYPKPDEDKTYVKVLEKDGVPQKDIVAASKRGRSHAREAKPRDDDFRANYIEENGWYVMIVADGAGSARYSRRGSQIACEAMQQFCTEKLKAIDGKDLEAAVLVYNKEKDDDAKRQENLTELSKISTSILYEGAKQAYKAIMDEVKGCEDTDKVQMRDFHTTLLAAICHRFDFGWFVASFGVGDGAIAVYEKDSDKIRLLNEPDGGEYAGQTRFLTMPEIFNDRFRIRISIVPDFTALMLMTDGISDPFFETDANLQNKQKWDALWNDLNKTVDFIDDNEASQDQLLSWLDFWSEGNHDDRTIAILY